MHILSLMLLLLQAPKALSIPTPTGGTHAVIIWTDGTGTHKEVTTQKVYDDQTLKASGPPPKPVSFSGSDKEWENIWNVTGKALGGRLNVSTPSTDYEDGSLLQQPAGQLRLYFGDQDIEVSIQLKPADYTGVPPGITANKCSIIISAGTKTGGKPDAACK